MNARTEKILTILIMLLALLLIITTPSWALKEDTHKAINEYIAQNTFNSFSLDDYLKNQLGMQKGKNTFINNKEIFKWLSDGGEYEDTSPRWLNHFHNPLTDTGLNIPLWGYAGKSAINWSLMPIGTQGVAGNYSWNDVRQEFRGQHT